MRTTLVYISSAAAFSVWASGASAQQISELAAAAKQEGQ
jgi:hypothetical protein